MNLVDVFYSKTNAQRLPPPYIKGKYRSSYNVMADFASAVEGPAARPVIYTMGFEHDMVQHALAQAGKKPAGVDYPNLVS
jgi:hypothetical protein